MGTIDSFSTKLIIDVRTPQEFNGGYIAGARNINFYDSDFKEPAVNADKFTKHDYDSLLANNKALLIDFYAPWCIPCKQMEPSLQKLTKKYKGKIHFARINIDEAKQLTRQLNIDAIPVLAVYRDGKELKRVQGLQSKSAIEKLAKVVSGE